MNQDYKVKEHIVRFSTTQAHTNCCLVYVKIFPPRGNKHSFEIDISYLVVLTNYVRQNRINLLDSGL